MTDCPNVEMRELLPELLHDHLPVAERMRVEAHVGVCEACTSELALLRSARRALARPAVPAIDTARIVAALPRPQGATAVAGASGVRGGPTLVRPETGREAASSPVARRRSPLLYRIAAAVTFISLGGMSLTIARSYFGSATQTLAVDSTAAGDTSRGVVTPVVPVEVPSPAGTAATASRGIGIRAVVGDLDDASLESLLTELDQLEAAPLAEPEGTPGSRLVSGSASGAQE